MRSKYGQFFSERETILTTCDSPADCVKKFLEAEYAFKKIMIETFMASKQDPLEFVDLALSNLLPMDKIPLNIDERMQNKETIKQIESEFIKRLLDDLKICAQLKSALLTDEPDYFYLKMFFQYSRDLIDVELGVTRQNIKKFLDLLLDPRDVQTELKKLEATLKRRDIHAPVFADIYLKKEMLDTFESTISPDCLQFIKDMEIIYAMGTYAVALSTEGNNRISRNRLVAALKKMLHHAEARTLIAEFNQICLAFSVPGVVNGNNAQRDMYLKHFDTMKKIYALERKMQQFLFEQTVQKSRIPEAVPVQQIQPEVVAEPKAELTRKDSPLVIADQETVVLPTELSTCAAPPSLPAEPAATFAEPEEKAAELPEMQEDKTPDYASDDAFYTPTKSKEKPLETYQVLELNLKKKPLETFLKVFDCIPYDHINLRALVNLTLEFGGVIKKSGANRCRIEIKNIYSLILVPKERLTMQVSDTSVSMHGGGHRAKRSQNHDREKAADYLITQFRSAFTRAGYTPATLGLNLEDVKNFLTSEGQANRLRNF